MTTTLLELRRIAESLSALRGQAVQNAVLRSDLRQLRLEFTDGRLAVVSLGSDDEGKPRLEIDIIQKPEHPGPQLEVKFESG